MPDTFTGLNRQCGITRKELVVLRIGTDCGSCTVTPPGGWYDKDGVDITLSPLLAIWPRWVIPCWF